MAKGWVFHPLSKPTDKGKSPGKRPLLNNWQQLTKTPENITDYINKGCNIGLVCGKASGITIIDLDHELFTNELLNGFDIDTLKSSRTRGRGHIYFKYNPNLPASKHHDLGIEILNDGSNAVLPPSIHPSGDVYKWLNHNAPIIPMPAELEKRLLKLFQTETELKQVVAKCRHCFRDVIKRKPDMHGAEGREYMLAVCTDLKANGATEEHANMFSKLMYQKDYDEKLTLQEWNNIDSSKTWQCETLKAKLPAYVDLGQCEKCEARRKEKPDSTEGKTCGECDFNRGVERAHAEIRRMRTRSYARKNRLHRMTKHASSTSSKRATVIIQIHRQAHWFITWNRQKLSYSTMMFTILTSVLIWMDIFRYYLSKGEASSDGSHSYTIMIREKLPAMMLLAVLLM